MTCEEFEEISGAYALEALTPEEHAVARAHVIQCNNCTRHLQELMSVVALLPLSVTQVTPPAALKERVLTAVQQEVRSAPNRLVPTQPRRRRPGLVTQLLAAAALIMLVLFGGMSAWNVSLHSQNTSLQQQITSLHRQLASAQQSNNATTQSFKVTSASSTSAIGNVIYLPEQNFMILYMRGLPQLQGKHVYQGWLIENSKPVSIGLLTVQNGVASTNYQGSLNNVTAAAISLEPGPNASAKPTTVVALGALRTV